MLKKRTSPKKKNVRLERRVTEVGVWHDCCHYLPVSIAKKRTTGWKETRIHEWGKIITSAAETINVTDLIVLLMIIKFAQDHPECTAETISDNGKSFLLNVNMTLNQLFKYVGNHDRRSVIGDAGNNSESPRLGSIMRLRTWIIQFWQNGDIYPVDQQFLYKYEINEKGPSTFSISKDFFAWCQHGENIDIDLLREINSHVAQALYLYLRGHRTNRRPKLETIVRVLGLPTRSKHEKYEAKRTLLEAFDRLQALHIVQPDYSGKFYYPESMQFVWRDDWNFYGGRITGYSVTPDPPSVKADWLYTSTGFPLGNQE